LAVREVQLLALRSGQADVNEIVVEQSNLLVAVRIPQHVLAYGSRIREINEYAALIARADQLRTALPLSWHPVGAVC